MKTFQVTLLIIKCFALIAAEVGLKQAGGGNYFEELLARIRDIRSSEKIFWTRRSWKGSTEL